MMEAGTGNVSDTVWSLKALDPYRIALFGSAALGTDSLASDIDLGIAEEILDREELTRMAAFHCQQSVEKSFKAILREYEQIVPRIHDLITLRAQTESISSLSWGRPSSINLTNCIWMQGIPPILAYLRARNLR